jgi:hypothetical protein
MKKYIIVRHVSVVELEREVNFRLQDGWEPHGGVCYDSNRDCYVQAMVHRG